jgi:tRNA (guanine26-N2/guanine27-N2)-dimethyltransferase
MVSTFYVCVGCQAFYEQPLGRMVEKVHALSGNPNLLFKTQPGPPVSQKCTECDSPLHVRFNVDLYNPNFFNFCGQLAGPMWSGPLHDSEFVGKVLEHLRCDNVKYGTLTRMKGVLTVAKEVTRP